MRAGMRRWAWLPLLAVSLALLMLGLASGGFVTVRTWFEGLCTSCIGLTLP